MRLTHSINALLLAALFIGSALAWPQLPDEMPVHFRIDGTPDRWAAKSLASWFAMPLFTLALAAFNYGMAAVVRSRPKWINLPNKEQFLTLPPERQAPVIGRVQEMLYGLTAPTTALFMAIQWMSYRQAMGRGGKHDMLSVLLFTVLMTPLILIVWMPRLQRELDQQLREHRAAGAGQEVGG